MALLASFVVGFLPMFLFAYIFYWLDRYEKEPLWLLGAVFTWGVVVAAGGAYVINSVFGMGVYLFTSDEAISDLTTASLSAPFVEEGLKGLAVVLVFLVFRKEFDSLLDGIIYAGISALGFAAMENSIYIWRGFYEQGWSGFWQLVFIRVILVGWQHPFYTSFIGMGLAIARMKRSWAVKILAVVIGWGLAMFTHSFHNFLASVSLLGEATCFVGTFLDWTGVFFLFVILIWAGWQEGKLLKKHLQEEISLGLISPAQYRTATSGWAQSFARLTALFNGRFGATKRFYQVCGELAHKKNQFLTLGDEEGNRAIVQKYRAELAQLGPRAQV